MTEKKLTRRELARAAALAGITVGIGSPLLAAAGGEKRFGNEVKPPDQQGWEKHTPEIKAPKKVKAGTPFTVTVTVGATRRHPNTVSHHIKWIQLFAVQANDRPMVHVGTFDFGPTFADPSVSVPVMLEKSARIYALGYCNLHGVWDGSARVEVE